MNTFDIKAKSSLHRLRHRLLQRRWIKNTWASLAWATSTRPVPSSLLEVTVRSSRVAGWVRCAFEDTKFHWLFFRTVILSHDVNVTDGLLLLTVVQWLLSKWYCQFNIIFRLLFFFFFPSPSPSHRASLSRPSQEQGPWGSVLTSWCVHFFSPLCINAIYFPTFLINIYHWHHYLCPPTPVPLVSLPYFSPWCVPAQALVGKPHTHLQGCWDGAEGLPLLRPIHLRVWLQGSPGWHLCEFPITFSLSSGTVSKSSSSIGVYSHLEPYYDFY